MTATTKSKTKTSGKEDFSYGDQVKVHFKVKEGESQRIQVFEGVVIRIRGAGVSKTFTVRKSSFGVGVERIFPFESPLIEKVELVKAGKVRRAKLYYLRKLAGKSARIGEEKIAGSDETPDVLAESSAPSPVAREASARAADGESAGTPSGQQ